MNDVSTGDMLAAVVEEGGGDSVKLIGDILEHNAREQEWLADQIQSNLERERNEWKARALAAEAQLDRIEQRLLMLLR